jgi:hypothetical protein
MDFEMNRKFQYYIDLLLVLTQKDLKVRYKTVSWDIYGLLLIPWRLPLCSMLNRTEDKGLKPVIL